MIDNDVSITTNLVPPLNKNEVKALLREINYLSFLSKTLSGADLMKSNIVNDINKASALLDGIYSYITIPDKSENTTARRPDLCGLMKVLMTGVH